MKSKVTETHDKLNCKTAFTNGEAVRFAISRNGETFQLYPSKSTPKHVFDFAKELMKRIQREYNFKDKENNLDRINRFASDMEKFNSLEGIMSALLK